MHRGGLLITIKKMLKIRKKYFFLLSIARLHNEQVAGAVGDHGEVNRGKGDGGVVGPLQPRDRQVPNLCRRLVRRHAVDIA